MKVKKLINILNIYSKNLKVYKAADDEGNSFQELYEGSIGILYKNLDTGDIVGECDIEDDGNYEEILVL
jgi:hypothetical protein